MAPYGDIHLGQHWLRLGLIASWHQSTIWTNVDLSTIRSIDIHLRAMLQEVPKPSITELSLKIASLKFNLNLPKDTALTHWPLRDGGVILEVYFWNPCYEFISWATPMKFLLDECHRTILMTCQHWFSQVMRRCHHTTSHHLSKCWPILIWHDKATMS